MPRRLIRKCCRYSSLEKLEDAFDIAIDLMQKHKHSMTSGKVRKCGQLSHWCDLVVTKIGFRVKCDKPSNWWTLLFFWYSDFYCRETDVTTAPQRWAKTASQQIYCLVVMLYVCAAKSITVPNQLICLTNNDNERIWPRILKGLLGVLPKNTVFRNFWNQF